MLFIVSSTCRITCCLFTILLLATSPLLAEAKERIKAIAIPLADHYAGIVAFEKYRNVMKHADYQLMLLPGPKLVRGYFNSEADADIAFNVCPMVMDMFAENPNFKWVSLIHRDGNAFAVNDILNAKLSLPTLKKDRKPNEQLATALRQIRKETGQAIRCAIPSRLATHSTVLYKYMKHNNLRYGFLEQDNADILLEVVKPPKSLSYLKRNAGRNRPAALEQSLPWPDIAESGNYGQIAWYSKDVMQHPNGHVECVIIAKNSVIEEKKEALREVLYYIHQAGQDIESARRNGGKELDQIITIIRKHIPQHAASAIKKSLNFDLNVINYKNLNVDTEAKESLRKIMDLAVEAGFLKQEIDIDAMADEQFSTTITER